MLSKETKKKLNEKYCINYEKNDSEIFFNRLHVIPSLKQIWIKNLLSILYLRDLHEVIDNRVNRIMILISKSDLR